MRLRGVTLKINKTFILQILGKEAITIYVLFISYFVLLHFLNSDNGYLLASNKTIGAEAYLKKAISRFYNYLFIVINYPFSIVLGLHYLHSKFILKKPNKIIDLAILVFLVGNFFHAILWTHNESPQIFRIATISFLALITFYYLHLGLKTKSKITALIGGLIILNITISFCLVDKKSILSDSETGYITVKYFEEIQKLISTVEQPKAIYLQNMDDMAHFGRAYPALYEEISHFAYFKNIPILQPITTSFFEDENSPIKNNPYAKSVIRNAPFQVFCDSLGITPSSFYDPKFKMAINLFVEKNSINLIIVDKKLKAIEWLKNSNIKLKVKALAEYGNENVYYIDN